MAASPSNAQSWLKELERRNAGLFRFDARKDPLSALEAARNSRKVHLVRAEDIHLASVARFPRLTELSLYEPRAKSLRALGQAKKLRRLTIEDPSSIKGLDAASSVTELDLSHFPKIKLLDPVGALKNLRVLSLSTTTSWDGSGRFLALKSFRPLGRLMALRSFEITGKVKARDHSNDWLLGLPHLRHVNIPNGCGFEMEDLAKVAAHLPRARGHSFVPDWIHPPLADILRCKKCRTTRVYLTAPGPKKRGILCPQCDVKALTEHRERWNAAVRAAKATRR